MDFFQSPSPNDQRRFSTRQLTLGVNPAKLNAASPDAAPQPARVNQTTPVSSAKTLDLMRQLDALAHEVALVSRGESSNQYIEVQERSNISSWLQLVKRSIRPAPRDQLTSDSPLFGRRTNFTLAGFFTSALDQLGRYRPSFDRASATLAGFFIAARDWLASFRPSFGRRKSATLANLFVAALIGVAVAFVWQFQRVSTAKSPNDVSVGEKQSGYTPISQLAVQDEPPQTASASQTVATSSQLLQQLEGMARDLVVLQRKVEELAAKQEHLVDAQEQLAARQEQTAQNIARPQPVKLPRPRPTLSVAPERR
jgi:hypothetical protein